MSSVLRGLACTDASTYRNVRNVNKKLVSRAITPHPDLGSADLRYRML